jgi:hypothetical protein
MPDVIGLLDKLVSSRYENSVTLLAAVHAEAGIPLNLGEVNF